MPESARPVPPATPAERPAPDPTPPGVETAVSRFEGGWLRGDHPPLEAFLPPAGPDRFAVLVELVHAELELRLKSGDPARVEEYLGRYPELRDPPTLASLVHAEYRIRRRSEPALGWDEFRARLPGVPEPTTTLPHLRREDEAGLRSAPVAPPGYEVEGELGRGGMGVVYRARQLRAGRVVALKMIRSGDEADEEEVERFRAEAVAAAALQHPNIAQVYEVGEYGGRPFFSMEYCPSGSLARQLAGTPLPPADAARLLVLLAEAVGAAHRKGIVHRDLKPGNVLLAADGTPKVADFGLAKQFGGDDGLTRSRAGIGTPSYMAPEQAADAKRVGPAADVYALGAVLYECLTGRPPFKGATHLDTLDQVRNRAPVPPAQLNPAVPRDLETVCLKCLEKEPGRRYPTVRELAEDLRRFLSGRPVLARRAGRAERAWKWVRRNPTVTGAAAAVVVALVAGSAVSIAFGMEARKQKREADEAAEREKGETARAEREAADAIAARHEVQRKNDELKRALARALLGRITGTDQNSPLTVYELDSFWQIAQLRHEEVAWMFLEESTQTPLACKQLACRSEYALHAAIGLDPLKRDAADRLVLSRFREPNLSASGRVALAEAIAQAGFAFPGADVEATRALAAALDKGADVEGRLRVARGLVVLAGRVDPAEAARPLAEAAHTFAALIAKETSPHGRLRLAEGLAAVAGRMDPAEAARACSAAARSLADVLEKKTFAGERKSIAQGLAALAGRMDPAEAAELCTAAARTLSNALDKERNDPFYQETTRGLVALAGRMDPAEAARTLAAALDKTFQLGGGPEREARQSLVEGLSDLVGRIAPAAAARALADAFDTGTNSMTRLHLAEILAALAVRMDPAEAGRACSAAARSLADALDKEPYSGRRMDLAQGLTALAVRMDPAEAGRVYAAAARSLADALDKETDSGARERLSQRLAALAERVDAAEGAGLCAAAARSLADALDKELIPFRRSELARGLAAVAERMDSAEAAGLCAAAARSFTDALKSQTESRARWDLTEGLVALARRMDPDAAALALAAALDRETDAFHRLRLAEGLAAVAVRMDPAGAARASAAAARSLANALEKGASLAEPWRLAEGLAAVTERMDAAEGAGLCAAAARSLANALEKETNRDRRGGLSLCLVALAGRMDAAQAARILTAALDKEMSAFHRLRLARSLAAVAERVDAAEAAGLCAAAARSLTNALEKEAGVHDRQSLAEGLAALAERMDPAEAARVRAAAAGSVAEALDKETREYERWTLAEGLVALTERMDPAEAARILTTALDKETTRAAGGRLVEGLTRLAFESPIDRRNRPQQAALFAGSFASSHNLLPSLPLLISQFNSRPKPTAPRELVELLKHPFCAGSARRVVLDALEATYRRPFADQWQFVEFARAHQPQLDLLTPPKRTSARNP